MKLVTAMVGAVAAIGGFAAYKMVTAPAAAAQPVKQQAKVVDPSGTVNVFTGLPGPNNNLAGTVAAGTIVTVASAGNVVNGATQVTLPTGGSGFMLTTNLQLL